MLSFSKYLSERQYLHKVNNAIQQYVDNSGHPLQILKWLKK